MEPKEATSGTAAGPTQAHLRLQTEDELRQKDGGVRQFIDAIPQHILIEDASGRLVFANKTWLDYHGHTLEEVMSSPTAAIQSIHPDDSDRVLAERARLCAGTTPFEMEFRVRRKDGEYRWFRFRLNPVPDQHGNVVRWYSSAVDIHDLKSSEDRLRNVVDTIPAIVHTAGPDGNFDFFNQKWLEYIGVPMGTLLGWGWTSVIHPEDVGGMMAHWRAGLASGEAREYEARVRRADGTYRTMLHRTVPLRDKAGKIVKWYGTSFDIEDRKRAEDSLQSALDEVQKLKDQLHKENIALRDEIDKASMFEEIVGNSRALQAVLSRVSKVAPTDSTVLISGETGTGKELIARAIHKRSQRASRAFVSVNCAAIPRDLIASELFGHEKGAFTGAMQQRLGRFEMAAGGTIFLDEVGELPVETQIALLRVLQEREFDRVGGTRSIQTDVRVIAATNRDLRAAIAAGMFRSDLFYRLNVFPIDIPPLRERQEDIPVLIAYFIDRYARKAGRKITGISKQSLDLLRSYSWPGNIRELQNLIERSVILCESESLSIDEGWLSLQHPAKEAPNQIELSQRLEAQEREAIEAALRECHGRVSGPLGAAVKLGMPRSTLESKIHSLKIVKNRFRDLS
jgi:PAS domain S-box-containing protein